MTNVKQYPLVDKQFFHLIIKEYIQVNINSFIFNKIMNLKTPIRKNFLASGFGFSVQLCNQILIVPFFLPFGVLKNMEIGYY